MKFIQVFLFSGILLMLVLLISTNHFLYSKENSKKINQNQIIADHTIVNQYKSIPQKYINKVKKMLVDMAGESHSAAYRDGMLLLEKLDSKFQVEVYSGKNNTFPPVSASSLRLGRHGVIGEAGFYTNPSALNKIKKLVSKQHKINNPVHVFGFAWCWDMTWHNRPGGGVDPEYGVRWAGASEKGPDGDLRWGLDAGDKELTGNSVCMDTYLEAVEEYNDYCKKNGYACIFIFTTGPVDKNNGTENGYQREIKHQYIRDFVTKEKSRILFDYADILCYNDRNKVSEFTWNGHTYKGIHPDNDAEDTGHISNAGALRLAKAMWWMLARVAGWDGINSN